jgi:hypothetical protein
MRIASIVGVYFSPREFSRAEFRQANKGEDSRVPIDSVVDDRQVVYSV